MPHWGIFKGKLFSKGQPGETVVFVSPRKSVDFLTLFSVAPKVWRREFRCLRTATRASRPGPRQHFFRKIAASKKSNAAFGDWILEITIEERIGLYLILKGVLNLILGFSVSNIIMLIVGVVALVLMLNRVPYINYIVAVFLAIMFLTHIGANLSNLGSQWIYLLEGLLDLGAAAVLVFEKNVKAFFGK